MPKVILRNAIGCASHAEGWDNIAEGAYSVVADGYNCSPTGHASHAAGSANIVSDT